MTITARTELEPGSINLTWDPPRWDGRSEILGYHVYRLGADGEEWIGTTTDQWFRSRDNTAPVRHHFVVRAFNEYGESVLASPESEEMGTGPASPNARPFVLNGRDLWVDADGDGRFDPGEDEILLVSSDEAQVAALETVREAGGAIPQAVRDAVFDTL